MRFQEMVNQAVKDRLFWSVYVDLFEDRIYPTSKGGTCLEFYNLLDSVGTYSKFLEIYISQFVLERYKDDFAHAFNAQHILSTIKDGNFCSMSYTMRTSHGNPRSMMITAISADGDYHSGKCVITASSIDNEYNILMGLESQENSTQPEDMRMKIHNIMLQSLGDLFYAVTLIDLSQNNYQEIISGAGIHPTIQDENDPQKALDLGVDVFVSEQDRQYLRDFLNLKTLADRIENQKSISAAFFRMDKLVQLSFLPVLRDENDVLEEVLLTIQIIDDRKEAMIKYQTVLKDSLKNALRLAETDEMTQLLNRRSGKKHIDQYLSNGGNGMFCLFDIDNFKHYNDAYGHDIGDKVIQGVSDCMRETFRNFDVLVRAGGDEFIVFAIGLIDQESGQNRLKSLEKKVGKLTIDKVQEKISISIGTVYSMEYPTCGFDDLYKEADIRMYQNKNINKLKKREKDQSI